MVASSEQGPGRESAVPGHHEELDSRGPWNVGAGSRLPPPRVAGFPALVGPHAGEECAKVAAP